MKTRASVFLRGALVGALVLPAGLVAQSAPLAGHTATPSPLPWTYTLLPDSQLADSCDLCGRPTITVELNGTFRLRLLAEDPLFSTYAVEQAAFTAGTPGGNFYTATGTGLYRVGGEVALAQSLFLELWIHNGASNRLCYFTNTSSAVARRWPMLQVSVEQTNAEPLQHYALELAAAPFQELWFSTAHSFTPGVGGPPFTEVVSAGDLISSAGRVVKRNHDLTARLGFMPMFPDLGLDAVDVLPGGEIAFSIGQDWFSEGLGRTVHGGDVVSDRGRVLSNYTALIQAFGPEPPPMDEGLDALQVLDSGEVYFSVTNDFFSEALGRQIRRGDLLSSRGLVVKNNQQLLAAFDPVNAKEDFGLDAVYVWPSGEIWFSVETGFYGQHFEFYAPGHLLSDAGHVVCRNLDLLRLFQPLEDLGDFGLDALLVVTDVNAPAPNTARCTSLTVNPTTGDVTLQWEFRGRVCQLEKALEVAGPYAPISSITTESVFVERGAARDHAQGFYRLRQW